MNNPIGIQIYTLRHRWREDFTGTLALLRKIGFESVEYVRNFERFTPEALAAVTAEAGLSVCGMHTPSSDLLRPDDPIFRYARAVRSPFVTTSLMPPTAFETWPGIVAYCRQAGKRAAEAGVRFTYHNHWYEPQLHDGVSILEKILEGTAPGEVALELDVAWAAAAGRDPAKLIEQYGPRIAQIHFKDIKLSEFDLARPQACLTYLGNGDVDLAACAAAAKRCCAPGTPFIYEQDLPDGDLERNVSDSFAVLRALC